MKKYMVISKDENGQSAEFFDDYETANKYFWAGTYGLGIYCELYAYMKPDDEYDAPETYICVK